MKKGLFSGLLILLAGTMFASSFSRDYISVDKVTAIKADLKHEAILVETTSDDEIKLEIHCNNRYKMPEITVEDDGVLFIKNVKKGTYAENCTIYVYLPSSIEPEFIEIRTLSGDIEIKNCNAETYVLSASSGDIDCVDINTAGDISTKTQSGDITLKKVKASEISATASSGDIDLRTVECEELNLEVISGDVDGEVIDVEKLNCNAKSGKIDLEKVDCDEFTVESVSGSVELKLNGEPSDASSIKTSSGSVSLKLPKSAAFQMEVASKSGNFDDDFDGNSFRPKSKVLSKYNGGGVNISVETKSGNISLDD